MAGTNSGFSIYTLISDGTTMEYPLNFTAGTLRMAYVRIAVEGEVDGEGKQLFRAFESVPGDHGMLRILGAVPASGLSITFQRVVPKTSLLHEYSNGSILDYPSLDESHLQLLMAIQEIMDGFGFQNINTDINMNGRSIRNVGKLTLQDFDTGVGPSFRELIDGANAQLALNQAEVAKAKLEAEAAAASALAAAQSAAEAAEAAGALSELAPRMDAVELVAASAKAVTDLATTTPSAGGIPKAGSGGKIPDWAFDVGDLVPSLATSKTGFLLCNGGAYSRTTYSALFALLGTAFGSGDGSTTFNVPDFRGKTIQGANANLMAVLAAGLPNIKGELLTWTQGLFGPLRPDAVTSGAFYKGTTAVHSMAGEVAAACGLGFDASLYNPIYGNSTTVQPPAIAVNIYIKY